MSGPVRPHMMQCFEKREKASRTILIGRRRYKRFLREGAADDGTCRCYACGQIDEQPWHDPELCPAIVEQSS